MSEAAPSLVRSSEACRAACDEARRAGRRIVFVPTMGFLHEGHARLMREDRRPGDYLVVSIFVNPAQFGPSEDLARYPRDLEGDLRLCAKEGVELVFSPDDPQELYPEGFQTWVEVGEVTQGLCGAGRPGHFRGVATVVTKLFHLVWPDLAVFGEKDFQQLVTIRTLVRDLDMPVRILGVPTVREPDGLALSSRNAYLDADARRRALCLWRGLSAAREAFAAGERRASVVRAAALRAVEQGADELDYVALADPRTLALLEGAHPVEADTRLLMAAFVNSGGGVRTRLIDNGALKGEEGA